MVKVLHILDSLARGGAEMQALDVCRNARENRLDLTFAATGGGALEADFRNSGAEFIRLNRRLPIDLAVVRQLRQIIKQRGIQIVQGYQPVEGLHLYLATIGLPVKRVLSFQGFIYDAKNRRTAKFLIPRMDANIVVSRGLRKWLEEKDGLDVRRNFHVVYNGADRNRITSSRKILREELNLQETDLLFGMIANFYRDPRKDQMTVCRALPEVFARIENAHCVFVGKTEAGAEDKYNQCVQFCDENKIADRVHFLGGRNDIPDVLASLDLFVFSSLQEGLPVAVSEAMLARAPMIVSDIEPLLEASGNGEYAEVFQTQNASELAEKIVKLLKDRNLREDLANRAFDFATENFSIEAHLRELKKLYDSIL
ncbi:MAG TPA: glycosyltransferase family 4 protein [Pyrinomonadaceae bacterium]|nr:glycosyltransferase family 4 protein [Pyrinomonadaceae bacterium]